ncbi:piggyBac transposable element-derived protein 4-like [Saccostrea echinata]|uniref:piggyBac transposable element-derived protein 4-like n=1 Tax=Saccostrea echinata TaxID=191078 RepID=UPI002A83A737|nr:piggyBac transposable element-derived protein 4-like [Saccostrea echinata]
MAERNEGLSDGSDIEIEYDDQRDDFVGEIDPEINGGEVNFLEENEEDADFCGYQNNWVYENFYPRLGNPFKKPAGATVVHPAEASAGQYLELFWTNELLDKLMQETNNYAHQEQEKNSSSSKGRPWRPVEMNDIKVFIALCFSMGILRLPDKSDYWRQSKWIFSTNFNKVMSRDRFFQIWRYLHIQNNEVKSETPDKLWKIRWLLEFLNTKFTELYVPYGNATVDESMIKFKGKLSFRQYSSKRSVKRGVKVYALAESETGYLSRFQIYTGKEIDQEKGLAHTVVMDLCHHYFGSNLCVYMDNFYTSPELLKNLHSQGIMACGAVRVNQKGLPKDLLPSKVNLQKHEFKVAQKDSLTYCVWQDTKPITVISNFHDPIHRGQVSRRASESGVVEVPLMVADYQRNMKGVDLCDQMVGYYLLNHRSKKWWRCIFFHLLMASAHNAYIVAKDTHPEIAREKWPGFQDFIEDIVEDLIGDTRARREPPKVDCGGRATAHDINIVKLFPKNKVCRECSLSGPQGQRKGVTKFGCRQCSIPVHLECSSKHFTRMMNVK